MPRGRRVKPSVDQSLTIRQTADEGSAEQETKQATQCCLDNDLGAEWPENADCIANATRRSQRASRKQ